MPLLYGENYKSLALYLFELWLNNLNKFSEWVNGSVSILMEKTLTVEKNYFSKV